MKRTVLISTVTALVVVAVALVCRDGSITGQEKSKDPEVKEVPLDSIYYSLDQKGLKALRQGRADEDCAIEMAELFKASSTTGAANIFLARGDTVAEIVRATLHVFSFTHAVDEPVRRAQLSKSDQLWLVAYLGTTGSHGEWAIKGAQIKGNSIRLTCKRQKGGSQLLDMHPYLVWVPLGRLQPGTYYLELFDQRDNHVTLMRRVTIPRR